MLVELHASKHFANRSFFCNICPSTWKPFLPGRTSWSRRRRLFYCSSFPPIPPAMILRIRSIARRNLFWKLQKSVYPGKFSPISLLYLASIFRLVDWFMILSLVSPRPQTNLLAFPPPRARLFNFCCPPPPPPPG